MRELCAEKPMDHGNFRKRGRATRKRARARFHRTRTLYKVRRWEAKSERGWSSNEPPASSAFMLILVRFFLRLFLPLSRALPFPRCFETKGTRADALTSLSQHRTSISRI